MHANVNVPEKAAIEAQVIAWKAMAQILVNKNFPARYSSLDTWPRTLNGSSKAPHSISVDVSFL